MKVDELDQIYINLSEFMPLYHQKFGFAYHKDDTTEYKCNKNQIKTIMIIGKDNKITPTMLGKCLDMRKGSLTTLVDSLEEKKLVYRELDKKDRRKTWLHLTKQGNEYLKLIKKQAKHDILSLFDSLSRDEIKSFNKSMTTIIQLMKQL